MLLMLLVLLVLLMPGAQLNAQSAATVPASSGLYGRLESVSALFPARGVFLGERALSQREMLRVVARLSASIDSAFLRRTTAGLDWARRELAIVRSALTADQSRNSAVSMRVAVRADLFASDAASQRIDTNGLGTIDAVSHAFAPRRDGWPTGQGSVASLATTGLLATADRLAIVVEPLFTAGHFRDGTQARDVSLHRAYARGVFRNVAVQLGSDERLWGQSPIGALFISGNAAPPPALALGTDTAITLPWLFRFAGPARFTAFVADLGPSQDPPHARLAGWQASIQPWSRFELGVAVLAQTGGNGGPKATFFERVVDLVPVIDALAPQHADLQISNKLAGGNLRLRFPELSNLDFYYELQIDDFDGRRLRSSLVDDAGHLLGARLPIITSRGQLAFRAEWHNTALRQYAHSQFRSGVTYREQLIGNPLGPNATGSYLTGTWLPSPATSVELSLADESRDPSMYTVTTTDTRDRGFRFVRLTDDPDYRRRRATASLGRPIGFGALRVTLGYNHVWRTGQPARGEWLGLLTFASRQLPTF